MNDLLAYFEKLELVAFFSAYPLFYLLLNSISSSFNNREFTWQYYFINKLSKRYAILCLLYMGMKINQSIPFSSLSFSFTSIYFYLKFWAFTGVLFFLPILKRKSFLTFFHSLPFISLVLLDFLAFYNKHVSVEVIQNEMRLYFVSLLLNLFVLALTAFYSYMVAKFIKRKVI